MGQEKSQPATPVSPGFQVAGSRRTLSGPGEPGRSQETPVPGTLPGGLVRAPLFTEPLPDGFEDTPMPEAARPSSRGMGPPPLPQAPSVSVAVLPTIPVEGAPGDPDFFEEAPPSSRTSKPPASVAPPLPQIPKPIASLPPSRLAPGIVSTQALPTAPARRSLLSPLLVAVLAAILGGIIALVVVLALKPKPPEAEAAPSTTAPSASGTPSAPAPTTADPSAASAAPSSAPAPGVTASSAASVAPTLTVPAAPASAPATATARASVNHTAPGAPPHKPKSDRIED